MPVSQDLLFAILAMDAYNQGYDRGLVHSETQIGTATFSVDDVSQEAQSAGFYAVAYNTPYVKVIAYRGTG